MSNIKMSDVFTDGEVMVTEWGDRYVLSDDFHLEIGELHQLSAAAHAINTHDAMQARIKGLEELLLDIKTFDVSEYLLLPVDIRKRIQSELDA